MQMYRVRFARKLPDDLVELGDCLVCAGTYDAARDAAAAILQLQVSLVEFEIVRVKPSFYLIGRRTVNKSLTSTGAHFVDAALASHATFPGITESITEEYWHEVSASAYVKAENEEAAIHKLADGLVREMDGEKQKSSTKELGIKCDRKEFHPASPKLEQNALYTHLRFFKGGDARGKG